MARRRNGRGPVRRLSRETREDMPDMADFLADQAEAANHPAEAKKSPAKKSAAKKSGK